MTNLIAKTEPRSEADAAVFTAEAITHGSKGFSESTDKLSDGPEVVGRRKRSYYLP